MVTLEKRWWLVADGSRAVEEGDPDAAYLFGNPGLEVTDSRARELGILPSEEKPKTKAGRKQMESPEAAAETDQEG